VERNNKATSVIHMYHVKGIQNLNFQPNSYLHEPATQSENPDSQLPGSNVEYLPLSPQKFTILE